MTYLVPGITVLLAVTALAVSVRRFWRQTQARDAAGLELRPITAAEANAACERMLDRLHDAIDDAHDLRARLLVNAADQDLDVPEFVRDEQAARAELEETAETMRRVIDQRIALMEIEFPAGLWEQLAPFYQT